MGRKKNGVRHLVKSRMKKLCGLLSKDRGGRQLSFEFSRRKKRPFIRKPP